MFPYVLLDVVGCMAHQDASMRRRLIACCCFGIELTHDRTVIQIASGSAVQPVLPILVVAVQPDVGAAVDHLCRVVGAMKQFARAEADTVDILIVVCAPPNEDHSRWADRENFNPFWTCTTNRRSFTMRASDMSCAAISQTQCKARCWTASI